MDEKEKIKEAIKRLHDRQSGDYETLIKQVEKHRTTVTLNVPQMLASMSTALFLYLEWGRGTGKTTQRGQRWSSILREMPRSTGLLIGPSYQFILTRIVPSLIKGLEMFGLYEGLHYFVGERPPVKWRKHWVNPYEKPKKYDRYISFWNGTGVHLISHDVPGDGRGLNADWADGDEAALLNPAHIQENTDPTLRGTSKSFEKSQFFGSRFYTTSTPLTPEGKWFLKGEELAAQQPEKYNFISATCEWNLHNLRKGYLEEARDNAYQEWVFLAEYKNKRPEFTKDGFYNLLDADIHCYYSYDYNHYHQVGQSQDCRGDSDLVKGVPLILSMDFGAAINCLSVNQHLKSINEYRTLNAMYVLGTDQKIQDDLLKNFHEYYRHHQAGSKRVFLYYDNTGNNETGITKYTRAMLAKRQLDKLGWEVQLMTVGGRNPDHDKKYMVWERILREDSPRLPKYRMNRGNCQDLYTSMRNAKAIPGRNGEVRKDKSSERSSKIPRQHATDLSDANDQAIFALFGGSINYHGDPLPDTIVSQG